MAGRRWKSALALWMLLLGLLPSAGAVSAEADYGVYVRDGGNVLSAQTANELYRRALWLNERTGTAQVGVVTVPALGGRSIEELAVATFRKLGLGSRERNDGVLLLYAAEEGRVRIEVGYGLEGRIPDGKAGAILDEYFVPYRDAGRLDEAFALTQSAIVRETAEEYGVDPTEATEGLPPLRGGSEGGGWLEGVPGYAKLLLGLGVVLLIFLDFKLTGGAVTFFFLNMLGRRGGGSGGGFGGGRGGGGSSGGGGASR